jgi:hypothetical protein
MDGTDADLIKAMQSDMSAVATLTLDPDVRTRSMEWYVGGSGSFYPEPGNRRKKHYPRGQTTGGSTTGGRVG